MNHLISTFADEELAFRSRILEFTSTILGLLLIAGILARHYASPTSLLAIALGIIIGLAFILVAFVSRRKLLALPTLAVIFFLIIAVGVSALSITGMGFISPVLTALIALPILGSSLMGTSGTLCGAAFSAVALFSVYFIESGRPNYDIQSLKDLDDARLVIYLFLIACAASLSRAIDGSREQKEKKLHELNLALEKEKKKAEKALEIRSLFLANMSHEIRTPINGILGMASLLKDEISGEAKDKLEVIESSGDILLSLINDILDFSKMDSGSVQLESIPVNLQALITKVHEPLRSIAKQKGTCIVTSIANDVPVWINGDPTKLSQVLFNLIGNAVKYSAGKNIRVNCDSYTSENDESFVRIAVKDHGVGIPKSLQSRLFKPFSQIDSSTTRRYGGTGLGLAISKSIVEHMGGKICVDSKQAEGSTFTFTFLASAASNPNLEFEKVDAPQFKADVDFDLLPLKILVAEDNEVNRMVVGGFLKKLGQTPDFAIDGQEALTKVKTGAYDLILMDCHMPNLDGFEATQQIIKLNLKNRPFIAALTASAMKEDRERCKTAGMDGFISKPLRYNDLLSLCTQISETQLVN